MKNHRRVNAIIRTSLIGLFLLTSSAFSQINCDFELVKTIPTLDSPESMCTGNLDSDPQLEFVTILSWSGVVVAYDHDGTQLWTQTTGWYGAINCGNIDGDPQDEVALNSADHHLYVYDSDGTTICVFPIAELGHDRPNFADLNGDGQNEVIFSEWDSNVYSVHPANVYALDPRSCSLLWPPYVMPDDAVTHTADVDNDGAAEIVVSSRGDVTTPITVLLEGDGSFVCQVTGQAWHVGFWDTDGNGSLDIITEINGITCYNYGCTVQFTWPDKGRFLRLADLDSDGGAEFLTENYPASDILCAIDDDGSQIWCHPFSGRFFESVPFEICSKGDLGIATSLLGGDSLFVLSGSNGTTIWSDMVSGATGFFRFPPTFGDMSGDGLTDLVIGNDSKIIRLYHQRGGAPIPTLTEWGLIIFGVVLVGFITFVFLKRRKAVVSLR